MSDDLSTDAAPGLDPRPGWQPLELFEWREHTRSFVSGTSSPDLICARFFRGQPPERLVGLIWLGPEAEGPPRHAHGGALAAVLDEAMGYCAWMNGHAVVAGRLSFDYHRVVPLRRVVEVEAEVRAVDGRKVRVVGRLHDGAGGVYTSGEGVFVEIGLARMKALMRGG